MSCQIKQPYVQYNAKNVKYYEKTRQVLSKKWERTDRQAEFMCESINLYQRDCGQAEWISFKSTLRLNLGFDLPDQADNNFAHNLPRTEACRAWWVTLKPSQTYKNSS